jgi:hypothetical protein
MKKKAKKPTKAVPKAPTLPPSPTLPFGLGPLTSKLNGEIQGQVLYWFETEAQRAAFVRGDWPTGIQSPKDETSVLSFEELMQMD